METDNAPHSTKGWLRLLIESVDVPLDVKQPNRLLFSTVQSLIPGAHGLYYRGNDGARKALSFDGRGHVKAPEDGWEHRDIYVHLAHGHRNGSSCGGRLPVADSEVSSSTTDAYSAATDRFEKTVALVQKMMASSQLIPTSGKSSRKASGTSSSENSEEEKAATKCLADENNELKKKLNDLEAELRDAKLELSTEKESGSEIKMWKEHATSTENRLDEAERMAESASRQAVQAEQALKATAKKEQEERNRADKAEWSLGEHRAWLDQAKARENELDGSLTEAHKQLDEMRSRAETAEWNLGEHTAWLNEARSKNEELTATLERERAAFDEKIQEIENAPKDLQNRISELEGALAEAHSQIDVTRERAERSEIKMGELVVLLAEAKARNEELTVAAEVETANLREKISSIESQKDESDSSKVVAPETLPECDSTVKNETNDDIEEEIQVIKIESQQTAPPSDNDQELRDRISELEQQLIDTRETLEKELKERIEEVSRQKDEVSQELEKARKRFEDETVERVTEMNNKIQELTEKEDELNNLHTVIDELREKLKTAERERSDAQWHLGEHKDWLKNERDKVSFLEEQLRRASAGESLSRPASRKNSTESGFGGSTITNCDENSRDAKGGSESPPMVRKMKFSSHSDDLASELMALSKDKQRMAEEIRQLKHRPDPSIYEAERHAHAEIVESINEKCARLESETAHFKDIAARVNLDEFNAKDGKIEQLQKEKADLEWKVGEHLQTIHDARWRIGELEGELKHLRSSNVASNVIENKDQEIRSLQDQKNALEKNLNDAKWRIGELESEVRYLKENQGCNSQEREELERLRKEWNDQKWRIGELESGYAHHEWLLSQRMTHEEAQALRNEKGDLERRLSEAWKVVDDTKWRLGEVEAEVNFLRSINNGDGEETNRLREEKKNLVERCEQLQKDWHDQKWRIGELESGYAHHVWVISELEKKIRFDNGSSVHERELEWKLGEVEKENGDLKNRLNGLEGELHRRHAAQESERPGQLEESLRALRADKEELERRVANLDKLYNDTKWRCGELEAGLSHTRWLLDEERIKVSKMNDRCESDDARDGSFIVRHRKPGDARLWQLAAKTSSDDTSDYRPVVLTIDEEADTDAVFIIGSFSTWECCARLSRSSHNPSKREATLYLPKGRHEFRFIVEGGWMNSSSYPTVPNPFGTTNNWISVE